MRHNVIQTNVCARRHLLSLTVVLNFLIAVSCAGGAKDAVNGDTLPVADEFHADNDIAMAVRSLADAIRVGEPLDSAQYDYIGVLTDGQGMPLYTDVQGSPGAWVIDVLGPSTVTMRNLYLGDLLPADLKLYILDALSLASASPLEYDDPESDLYDDTQIEVFDFNGGYLRFEIRSGIAPNGLEGPLLTIILSGKAPAGTQTDAMAQNVAKP